MGQKQSVEPPPTQFPFADALQEKYELSIMDALSGSCEVTAFLRDLIADVKNEYESWLRLVQAILHKLDFDMDTYVNLKPGDAEFRDTANSGASQTAEGIMLFHI